ncbi:phage tail protein [Gynuella sp.]|uniref:phage tail protein n=1 Tax=Gynuella sp. TaxID=2969146 RepID=UPI003D0FEA5B
MSIPFYGEIRMWATVFAPRSWANCDGQILAITDNQALAALIGAIYGGDGRNTFALPDMRGRTPLGDSSSGGGYSLGLRYGFDTISLSESNLPSHTHTLKANTTPGTTNFPISKTTVPVHRMLSQTTPVTTSNSYFYYDDQNQSSLTSLHPNMISDAGGSQGHFNIQPSLGMRFCIAMDGLFPSRN